MLIIQKTKQKKMKFIHIIVVCIGLLIVLINNISLHVVNAIESTLTYTFNDGDMDSNELINSGFYIVDHKMEQTNGPSRWEVKDGKLVQSSNVYNPTYEETTANDNHENSFTYGTKLLFGDTRWIDYTINVDVTPRSSSGSISILFKYQDDKNFYRYVMEHGKYNMYSTYSKFLFLYALEHDISRT